MQQCFPARKGSGGKTGARGPIGGAPGNWIGPTEGHDVSNNACLNIWGIFLGQDQMMDASFGLYTGRPRQTRRDKQA
jgi:hypothetical protein